MRGSHGSRGGHAGLGRARRAGRTRGLGWDRHPHRFTWARARPEWVLPDLGVQGGGGDAGAPAGAPLAGAPPNTLSTPSSSAQRPRERETISKAEKMDAQPEGQRDIWNELELS